MLALDLTVGGLGVGDLVQVGDDPPEPGWVQAAGRRHQHRLGLRGHLGGQVTGAMGQRAGVGGRHLAVA